MGWQWWQLRRILRPAAPQVAVSATTNPVPSPLTLPPLQVQADPFSEAAAKALLSFAACNPGGVAGGFDCQGSIGAAFGARLSALRPLGNSLILTTNSQPSIWVVAYGQVSGDLQSVVYSLAQGVIQAVDPATGPYALQEPDPSTANPGAASTLYVETYQNNPIWDTSWVVTVSRVGIVAERLLWVRVISHGTSQSVVSAQAAIQAVEGASGSYFQTGEAVLGYDVPQVLAASGSTPQGTFTLDPVYRVQAGVGLGTSTCYFVLAYTGEVVTDGPGSQVPYRQPC